MLDEKEAVLKVGCKFFCRVQAFKRYTHKAYRHQKYLFFFIFEQSSIMMMKKKWVRDGGKDWFLWPLKMRSRSCSNCWWKNANKTSIVVFRPWYVSLQLRSRIKWSKKKYDFWVQIRGPPPAPSSLLVRSFFREYYDNFLVEPVMEELLLHQLLL